MQMKSRIYVGNIPFDVGEMQIRTAFSHFGAIKQITFFRVCCHVHEVSAKRNSFDMQEPDGRSRGFCFIDYFMPDSVTLAEQAMNNFPMNGRFVSQLCL